MNYSKAVERALGDAEPMVVMSSGEWVPEVKYATAADPALAALHHGYPFKLPSSATYTPPPNQIIARNLTELSEVAKEAARITGHRKEGQGVLGDLLHEGQHAEVIRQLGGNSLYAVDLHKTEGGPTAWLMATIPFDAWIPKIGWALFSVYPLFPSTGDRMDMLRLGYRSVVEVGAVAARFGLPQPLSLQR
jgi:hypothetical protein